jgi:hypothetical protein
MMAKAGRGVLDLQKFWRWIHTRQVSDPTRREYFVDYLPHVRSRKGFWVLFLIKGHAAESDAGVTGTGAVMESILIEAFPSKHLGLVVETTPIQGCPMLHLWRRPALRFHYQFHDPSPPF